MTISQAVANYIAGNFVVKRHQITFTEEKEVFIHFPTFLSVSTVFPSNWNPPTNTTQSNYVILHPMNRAYISLRFNPLDLATIPNKAYLNSLYPSYNIGRVMIGTRTPLSSFSSFDISNIYYPFEYLFKRQLFNLDGNQDPFSYSSIYLSFFKPLTGTLSLLNPIYYPAPL